MSETSGYEQLRTGAARISGTHELVRVVGPDAIGFVDDLITQDIKGLSPGAGSRSFLLSPKGKLRAMLWVRRLEDGVDLVTDAGFGQRVIEDLNHYRIRVKLDIDPQPQPVAMLVGPMVGPSPTSFPAPLPGIPRWFDPVEEAGYPEVGLDSWTAVRVEEGEPVMDRDIDEGTIPQETGLEEEAVAFDKGCYLGQELVARIHSRGHVNRHLRGAVVEAGLPAEASPLSVGEREVGRLTSVTVSPRLGTIGLALVRREVEPGDTVTVRWDSGESKAVVQRLPMLEEHR